MQTQLALTAALLGMCLAGTALAGPQPGDLRVTDPAQIRALGFDPATDEVFLAAPVDDRALLAARLARGDASPQAPNPDVDPIWTSVVGTDFRFNRETVPYTFVSNMSLTCSATGEGYSAYANIEFPNDHRITWMDVWAVDNSTTSGVRVSLWEICQRVDNPDPSLRTVTRISPIIDTGTADAPDAVWLNAHVGPDRWVHAPTCSYLLRADLDCANSAVRLQKVRVLWDYD
ncbi:MAG: hypothetical protein IT467_06665 [Dokdonella sp.]|uniref:hypothetical protein n=1 Tax=Dokdonella sp. TaxID=2291710 RepID=UPI0025BE4D29|nr:hypothetical protein [Dokdonella sp.]MBZ0222387.1 hypothetical protein [Dokdonella sp.]MCC7255601.1 hypothetical protein [Dokdonella sp.]